MRDGIFEMKASNSRVRAGFRIIKASDLRVRAEILDLEDEYILPALGSQPVLARVTFPQ